MGAGNDSADEAGRATAAAFERFGGQLNALGRLSAGADHATPLAEARSTKLEIEALLRPYMSRTERPVYDDGAEAPQDSTGVALDGPDLDVYRHFADRVGDRFKTSAMAVQPLARSARS